MSVDWTPTEVGEHHIYAEVVESVDDADPGDAWDVLTVQVQERPPAPLFALCGFGLPFALSGLLVSMGLRKVGSIRRIVFVRHR